MFWALNGATRRPWSAKMRQRAVTRTLLPTDEAVPWSMSVLAATDHLSHGVEEGGILVRGAHGDADVLRQAE